MPIGAITSPTRNITATRAELDLSERLRVVAVPFTTTAENVTTYEPPLIPELDVSDFAASIRFYVDVLEFRVVYERRDEAFAMLEREGARLMIEAAVGPGRRFATAPLEKPYGRGVNFQIRVSDVRTLYARIGDASVAPLIPLEERWYDIAGDRRCNRQFVVADPDGYLLRFFEDLG